MKSHVFTAVFLFAGLSAFSIARDAGPAGDRPAVLLLGDSISIGYTPFVREMLADEADVRRPDTNCAGTKKGLQFIDQWLGDARWAVIHFNWGLHDLKHVDASGKNSTNPEDPQQSPSAIYEKNLDKLVTRMKETGAILIFATTTPYPDRPDGPLRRAGYAGEYNAAARRVMKKHDVRINDLHAFCESRLKEIQRPHNVHFTKEGSRALARQAAAAIRDALPKRPAHAVPE
jgi:hypothetical protein